MTSVTTGSPVSRLASARYLSPSSSSPWKEYGDVRGLKAPPRKTRAPAALTFAATSSTCPRDSTEHGPAITTISLPPIRTPSTGITVASRRTSRLASLKGWRIGCTASTHSSDSRLLDRKSTRLNSSHGYISYAVFCLKKKKNNKTTSTAH